MTPQPPEERREPLARPETPPDQPVFGPPGADRPASRDLNLPRRYSRWAMWGCLTLTLTGLLLGGGLLLVMMQRPGFDDWARSMEDIAVCREHLLQISGALYRYYTDKSKLPARIEELNPTYLANREYLTCPADAVRKPAHSSYTLRAAMEWGKGDGIVVVCPHHPDPVKELGFPVEKNLHYMLVIRQDGNVTDFRGKVSEIRPRSVPNGRASAPSSR